MRSTSAFASMLENPMRSKTARSIDGVVWVRASSIKKIGEIVRSMKAEAAAIVGGIEVYEEQVVVAR